MTVIHVLPKRFEDFLRHLGCNSPRPSIVRSLPFTALARHGGNHKLVVFSRGNRNPVHVGYAQKQLQQGFTMSGATFVPVGGGDVNIGDIKPNGESVDEGTVNIQILDSLGHTVSTYTYMGADMFDDGYPAGWYDEEGIAQATFAAGTGLWIAAPDGDTSLTFSGAVPKSDVTIVLRNGYTAAVNMMPMDVSIQDILPAGSTIDEGTVNIQILDSLGHTIATYTFMGQDMFDDGYQAGWYDDEGLADVLFPAGTGLWVAAPDSETSITFPAPEL